MKKRPFTREELAEAMEELDEEAFERRINAMHLNRIHGILKKAGLKPYNPIRGVNVGYHIYTEQLPFDHTRYVCVYFRSATPWDRLPLEQAQEAAIAALSMAGLQVEVTRTLSDWPAIEFKLTSPKAYRRMKIHSTE